MSCVYESSFLFSFKDKIHPVGLEEGVNAYRFLFFLLDDKTVYLKGLFISRGNLYDH
jgi:hypothetical protein